jgi:hypothetical protein
LCRQSVDDTCRGVENSFGDSVLLLCWCLLPGSLLNCLNTMS